MSSPDSPRVSTVLVVDDKKNMLSLMKKVLRADARVLTAERGLDALKILEAEPVDVVLCDLRMPDMDGVEVLEALQTSAASCRVHSDDGLRVGGNSGRSPAPWSVRLPDQAI